MEKTENSTDRSSGERRWLIIIAALVLVVAVVCGGHMVASSFCARA